MRPDQIPLSRGVFERMTALGLDIAAVLRHAELPRELLMQPRACLTTAQFFALWRAIEAASDDPALGLRLGDGTRAEVYDVVSLAALHSATLGDALHKLARYKRLTCPEDISIELTHAEAAVSMRWMLADGHTPPLLVDAIFASNLALAERGSGRAIRLRRLELTRRPTVSNLLSTHFRCELRFNAAQDRIVYDRADLELPFVTHDEDHLATLMPTLEASLHELSATTSLSDKVWNVLARGMRGSHQRMAQVAAALHLSPRTLQRRLGEAGTSYQQLLDQVRHHLARHLLDATDLDTGEIAFLLGFEELNSFNRAFRQWEGKTPSRRRTATMG
ncbi:AraC family transcriptional regulator [Dyella tabacisoli]|uniref:AraC family transcriptional regulator n=1 Tax=Dyella tabacisoli TaxID=2282381 RepID=A0A369UKH7_9GAMM|nr:AraC family transcriptional regulator [Dyella tabacisoli]RDD81264.1 AraC family transcriptional regulator [Dyella tabacisoli]